jgi:hypothetical protein
VAGARPLTIPCRLGLGQAMEDLTPYPNIYHYHII